MINTPDVLTQLGPQSIATAAGRHGLSAGFASARQQDDDTALLNAVLRFPDPDAAAAARVEMGAAATHPFTFTPHGSDRVRATVRSFTSHGPYVLMQFAQSIDGRDRATGLVAKTLDAQLPHIDRFTPRRRPTRSPPSPTATAGRCPSRSTAWHPPAGTRSKCRREVARRASAILRAVRMLTAN